MTLYIEKYGKSVYYISSDINYIIHTMMVYDCNAMEYTVVCDIPEMKAIDMADLYKNDIVPYWNSYKCMEYTVKDTCIDDLLEFASENKFLIEVYNVAGETLVNYYGNDESFSTIITLNGWVV